MRNWRLWIILLVALAVRLALLANGWVDRSRLLTPDSRDYLELASDLSAGEHPRFSRPPTWGPMDSVFLSSEELFRTPGYPAFLCMTRAAPGIPAGIRTWTDRVPFSVTPMIAQVILDVVLVCLVFLLARTLFSERVGLLAAAIQAITPVSVVAAVQVLSDSLFAVLLTGSILLLVWYLKKDRKVLVFPAGLLLGLACLVRPIGGPFAVVAFGAILAMRCDGLNGHACSWWALPYARAHGSGGTTPEAVTSACPR